MTKYDFDKETDRLGTQSVKWDSIGEGVLPMWVADMDFEVAPCIQRAVQERAAHPIYGYTYTPKEYYDAVTGWFSRRHNWQIDRSWILHTPGVVAAMSLCHQGHDAAWREGHYRHRCTTASSRPSATAAARLRRARWYARPTPT